MTGLVHLVTKRYGLVFAVLLILALLVVTPAAAQICWGKVCTIPGSNCCDSHGKCNGFNDCLCDPGWTGRECETSTFCGQCTNLCDVSITGYCDIPGSTGTCHCRPGYTGTCCDLYSSSDGYPAPYAFGNVRTGTTAAMSSPVIFAADHPNIMVKSIGIGGANAGDFTLSGGTCTPGTILMGTGGCTGAALFTPSASGSRTADMTVTFIYPYYNYWPDTPYGGWGKLNGKWWLSPQNYTYNVAANSTLTGTGLDVPAVTGISPATGPAAGGTVVTITGTGFSGAENVKFGLVPNATGMMTVSSDTSIIVTSPAGAAGVSDITVTNPVSTSSVVPAGRFTYTGPATHFSVTAPSPATAGTPFTFTVTALDALDNPATDYAGLVNFTSTDSAAALSADSGLVSGTKTFSATLRTTGSQTITGTDTVTASITGTSGAVTVSIVPVPTPTPVPTASSGGFVIGGSDNDGGDSGNSNTQLSSPSEPLATISVNVGGSTSVSSATITGTGISGVVVTATEASGPGNNLSPPPGTVYKYLDITPAHYGTITGAMIMFTVPQSWLDEHHMTPQDVVMYHNVGTTWQVLPSSVLKTENGQVYFSATTPGFSLFEIAVPLKSGFAMKGAFPVVQTIGDLTGTSGSGTPASKNPVKTLAPVVQQTTAAPPAPAAPDTGFPLATIALIGAGCIVLIGSGWYIRRWYIRLENPALFRDYD